MDWLFQPFDPSGLLGRMLGPGFTPALVPIGAVMYLAWTAAYALIIRQCFRERTYGIPLAALLMNIVWEFCYSFNILDQNLAPFFVWGNRLWFVFDVVIVYQMFKWGKEAQVLKPVKDNFYAIVATSFIATAIALPVAIVYINDLDGIASSFTMNLNMSILFLFMLYFRPDLKGLNYPAAWLKMIGTAAGALLCIWWYPGQFENGFRINPAHVAEPPNYYYLYTIYILIFLIDALYVHLLGKARKKLAAEGATATA